MPFFSKRKRKQPEAHGPPTFKERVEAFYDWFGGVEQRFYETIEDGRCAELTGETRDAVARLIPGFDWVYGPGPFDKGGHSFTLSGKGIIHFQFLTEYWVSQAPELEHWSFYPSRQPGELHADMAINIAETAFKFGEMWITPTLDTENEVVDVKVWHPGFGGIEENLRMTVLFILLDEALGEYGTEQWLGEIEIGDDQLADAMPLPELRQYLHDLEIDRGWKKLSPTESTSMFQIEEPGTFLHGDIFIGCSRNMRLLNDFLGNEGKIEDPVAPFGAEHVFVAFDSGILPAGSEVEFRSGIEDALEDALMGQQSGTHIGGMMGVSNAYIDLLIFDGERSIDLIMDVLRDQNLPTGTGLHFFGDGNKGRRRFL